MIRSIIFCTALTFMHLAVTLAFTQAPTGGARIPWRLTVVVMDGTDPVRRAEIPVREAVRFIEARTRFKFDVNYVVDNSEHGYTPYPYGRDRNQDGKGDYVAYAMMGWDVPKELIDKLPVSSSYLFLYRLKRKRPAQAGSALGIDYGLMKGGKPRPYATIPTDQFWFINEPNQGFRGWAAQIVAHEVINTIQGKIEAAPYNCGQLVGTQGVRGDRHEAERLKSFTEACYAKLGNNAD
ncbi:MAG: hypothetical protein ABIV21_00955 [Pyrinomonadaceae bacterium]